MFSTWSEVEFVWDKTKPILLFLVSVKGLVLMGFVWLTGVVFRPVSAEVVGETIEPPEVTLTPYDGERVVVAVRNTGGDARFSATGQILKATWDHKQKYPYKMSWLQSGKIEIQRGKTGRIVVADLASFQGSNYLRVWGDGGSDFAQWSLGHGKSSVKVIVDVVVEADPPLRGDSHVRLEIDASQQKSTLAATRLVVDTAALPTAPTA